MNFRPDYLFLLVLSFAGWLIFGSAPAAAQAAMPARPVDPSQPMPAQPVEPNPASPAPAVTNAASGGVEITAGPQLTVLADSSLRNVLQELAQSWADEQPDGRRVPLTLTNEGTMMTQVQSNPSWDVVISADSDDLKTLTDKGLLASDGQRSLARNILVVYGRKALLKDDDLDWFDLVGTEWKKVAMGNPDLVESGRVAKHALQAHDLFDEDHKKMYVNAGTEALALQVVERDQADAVFVYRTDLARIQLPGFEPVSINSADAPPVFYTAAVGKLARDPDGARSFINYCGSEAVRDIWSKYGFEMN